MDPDPWNWSVQDVVDWFRNDANRYMGDLPHGRLPQLDPFLNALNENEITGAALLTSVDTATLRDDCGVSKLGERSAVQHCISKLKRQSAVHATNNNPFGLQTPPQLPAPALQPATAAPALSSSPFPRPPATALNHTDEAAPIISLARRRETEVEDANGRKRRKLNLLESPDGPRDVQIDRPAASTGSKRGLVDLTPASARLDQFRRSKFPIDEIFYGKTQWGSKTTDLEPDGNFIVLEEDQNHGLEDESFQFVEQNKSVGESLYVYSHLRHFLNTTSSVEQGPNDFTLSRRNRLALGFMPYRDIPNLKTRSATVLQFEDDEAEPVAVRENAAYVVSGFDLEHSSQQLPGENDYLLEKYGPSEVLPALEDDEDDDSDDASERLTSNGDAEPEAEEDEEEEGTDLSPERGDEVVDQFITEHIDHWHDGLPRLEEKAWSVWRKMRSSKEERRRLIAGAEATINHLTKRLVDLKRRALSDSWPTEAKLLEACAIMEPTIEDREEQRWKVSVWKRTQEPIHTVVHGKRSKRSVPTAPIEGGDSSRVIEPYDRFSLSPGPVMHEFQENAMSEERPVDVDDTPDDQAQLLYDADDEELHTAYSQPTTPFVVPTPDGSDVNMEENEPDGEDPDATYYADALEEFPDDLPNSLPLVAEVDNIKDETYQPDDNDDSESEQLASPSTFVPPRSKRTPSKSKTTAIDLTGPSDSSSPARSGKKSAKAKLQLTGDPTAATASEVDSWELHSLAKSQDRMRMLIKMLKDEGAKFRDHVDTFVRTAEKRQNFEADLQAAVQHHRDETLSSDMDNGTMNTMKRMALIYMRFQLADVLDQDLGVINKEQWEHLQNRKQISLFTKTLCIVLVKKSSKLFVAPKSSPTKKGSSTAPIDISSSSNEHATPIRSRTKKRKVVKRSVAARDSRNMALGRQQRFNESQTTDASRLALMIASDPSSQASIAINPAKDAEDDFVYIHENIAGSMKAHQIDGAQFLWREITVDGEEGGQGCVLAHTMGLGKTMQTIALLVALNEAATSDQPTTYKQLPPPLRNRSVRKGRSLRVLVMCPPALLDNWAAEIEKWASRKLGKTFILDTSHKQARAEILDEWTKLGGVLLIGYKRLNLMFPQRKAEGEGAPSADEVAHLESIVLKGAEIVIADEAHHLKSPKSQISMLAARFSTESRIALTGTPMSNDVDEIYALVSWVAPGFLGDSQEFSSQFGMPIKLGLYADSAPSDKRRSTIKLKVLHAEIAPKVNRANIEVLRGSLKSKTEYILTVPLTGLQLELYRRYIKAINSGDKIEGVSSARIFGWLGTLALVANHPYCFREKLLTAQQKPKKKSKDDNASETTSREETPSTSTESGSVTPRPEDTGQTTGDGEAKDDVEQEIVPVLQTSEIEDILRHSNNDMDPSLSAKASIFMQLLQYSLECGDKVLIFSGSIPTLNYLSKLLDLHKKPFGRIDGAVAAGSRTSILERFHKDEFDVMLISTKAGGVGLNIQGANRVFIFDFKFNPSNEEQAIGRAYRLGQQKPVFVYRFVVGGTFETNLYNMQLFKSSLSARVVDKKNPRRNAKRNIREYLHEPREVEQEDLSEWIGKDSMVLDRLLEQHGPGEEGKIDTMIRAVQTMETLQEEAMDAPLDEDEQKMVESEIQLRKDGQKGKKAMMNNMPPPATAIPRASASEAVLHPARPVAATQAPQASGGAPRPPIPTLKLRKPDGSGLLPASTMPAQAAGGAGPPHAHPMGGLPVTQQPSLGPR